jgi:hypothetical protein
VENVPREVPKFSFLIKKIILYLKTISVKINFFRCWDFFPAGDCFRKQYESELGGGGS